MDILKVHVCGAVDRFSYPKLMHSYNTQEKGYFSSLWYRSVTRKSTIVLLFITKKYSYGVFHSSDNGGIYLKISSLS